MSSSWHGGKGDSSRTKNNVKYSNNWDSIFRTNQIIEGLEPAEVYEERKERYERVMAPHRSKDIQPESTINKEYPDTKNAFFFAEEIEQIKKKEVILKAELDETPEQKQRREHVDLLEADASIAERKRYWKDHNPNENLKSWKTLYIQGRIDKLPWVPDEQGYVQNSEQSDDTIWKRLKK